MTSFGVFRVYAQRQRTLEDATVNYGACGLLEFPWSRLTLLKYSIIPPLWVPRMLCHMIILLYRWVYIYRALSVIYVRMYCILSRIRDWINSSFAKFVETVFQTHHRRNIIRIRNWITRAFRIFTLINFLAMVACSAFCP